MAEYTNKEIIQKLQKYFLEECDPKIVAYTLAGAMVDINRIHFYFQNVLPKSEVDCLLYRIEQNSNQLREFIKNGAKEPLECRILNSDEFE